MPLSLRSSMLRRLGAQTVATLVLGSSLLVAVATAGSAQAATKGDGVGPVEVSGAIYADLSAPVRDLTGVAPTSSTGKGEKDKPLRPLPNRGNALNQTDGALQGSATASSASTAGLGFAGVGQGDYGYSDLAAPPDTNGAVGATQYVQWVNTSFAVFDKATGAIAAGFPKAGNSIWAGFGGGCQTNNDGDPIVQYDKLASRWILTQFSVSSTPYLQCVAVSTTSDATGSYNRYAFSYGTSDFNDYPKLGVWPDGYYVSYNIFTNAKTFAGSKVCAFDRTKMLGGDTSATQQCFQLSTSYGGLLPSDLDGTTAPPAGSPNFFMNYGANSLNLWKFHVDWANSANTTFTGPTPVANVAAFSPACGGGGTCIPQPGVSQQLDSLADRLMYRLAYRNFGDHESVVVNQSVTAGSSVGVRWYEIRTPNGSPTVYQQGTYAPDSTYRWMGSIAMDKVGDIAVGYSGSSGTTYPYVAYASRTAGDALGTLSAETIVKAGGGSQYCQNFFSCFPRSTLSRWGDYSALSIDPVDDCTFWYTNEYEKTSGAFNWSTWITSFSFPGCTSVSRQSQTVTFTSTAPASAIVGGPTYTPTATSTSGLTVAFTIDATAASVCSMSGGVVSFIGTGTCVIDANQAGNATYNPAPQVQQSFVVGKGSQTVTFTSTAPTGATVGGPTYTPTASASSGLAVTFTIDATASSVCSISGSTVSFFGAGTCVIDANQSGNANYNAASQVQQSFTVTAPASPDFSISANPASRSVRHGNQTTYTVTITPVNGFTGIVNLSVGNLPSGVTASFSPASVSSAGSSTLTLSVAKSAAPVSNVTLTLTGTSPSPSQTHSTTVLLTIR